MFNIKLEAHEQEISLDNLMQRIIRTTRPKTLSSNSSPFGGPSSAIRGLFADMKIDQKHGERIRKLIEGDAESGRLKVVNKGNQKIALIYDLVEWTNSYGKLVEQAAYPGQKPYVHDCYERLRELKGSDSDKQDNDNQKEQNSSKQKKSDNENRKQPNGGDSITSIIWEVCYDLHEKSLKITPAPVMFELQIRAQSKDPRQKGRLMWPTADGVMYEYAKGDERELTPERLRARIKEWKKANGIDQMEGSGD